jgi:hypothetical protein
MSINMIILRDPAIADATMWQVFCIFLYNSLLRH